jgi:hypothetical protein
MSHIIAWDTAKIIRELLGKKYENVGTKPNGASLNLHDSEVQTSLSFRFFPP